MTDKTEATDKNTTTEESDRNSDRDQRQAAIKQRLDERVQERLMQRRARERDGAKRNGNTERGLFTGRGNRDDDDDESGWDEDSAPRKRRGIFGRGVSGGGRSRPRTGAKRSVMAAITQLPKYLRLLIGLISDSRVSRLDRFFVIAAVAYIVSPIDLIPDVIPFFGEVDDVFLLMLALQRLVNNAGRPVLLSHWSGDPDDVHNLNFARIISAAGFFLPTGIKRRLFKLAGLAKKFRL